MQYKEDIGKTLDIHIVVENRVCTTTLHHRVIYIVVTSPTDRKEKKNVYMEKK